ncbi:MAG: CRISPR-associated DxTHG motif protein [Sphingomonadales bacterium]|nr:MAG: CRISPR-associated DxTHG motif protein [Sphingomonadales bacterium]
MSRRTPHSHSAVVDRHSRVSPSQTLDVTHGVGFMPPHCDPCTSASTTRCRPKLTASQPLLSRELSWLSTRKWDMLPPVPP